MHFILEDYKRVLYYEEKNGLKEVLPKFSKNDIINALGIFYTMRYDLDENGNSIDMVRFIESGLVDNPLLLYLREVLKAYSDNEYGAKDNIINIVLTNDLQPQLMINDWQKKKQCFVFDEDFKNAMISQMMGRSFYYYCDNAPRRNAIWNLIMYYLDASSMVVLQSVKDIARKHTIGARGDENA